VKKLLVLIVLGIVVGLGGAFLLLYSEFGGVQETLSPYRPEGMAAPGTGTAPKAPGSPADGPQISAPPDAPR
jgi:hypothetical protein